MGTITTLVLLSVLILQPAINQENILTALRLSSATTAVPFLLLFALTPFDRPGSAVHTWLTNHGAADWREAFQAAHPAVPDWFATAGVDLSDRLVSLPIPTLLLWGDADPISPVAVGRRLADRAAPGLPAHARMRTPMDPRLIEYERTLPVIDAVPVGLLFVVSGHPLRQESHSNGKENAR